MNVERLLGNNQFNECLVISKLRSKAGGTKPISETSFIEKHQKYFEGIA
jgi:hypothetical protein